jgi:serine/threonine protein kinase
MTLPYSRSLQKAGRFCGIRNTKERTQQYASVGNLVPIAARNHSGNQRNFHADFLVFTRHDLDLVSIAKQKSNTRSSLIFLEWSSFPTTISSMTLKSGARLGPYEVVSMIGAGGMGEVYAARDPRLGRKVAIKVLPHSFFDDRERLRRFEQEAKTAGALNHPNLVAIYDLGLENESPYLVMELLEGETLRARIREGSLPLRKAKDFALQIAHGVAAAHEKGIVHRDLKPENIFITRDGRLKILDFGLAKQALGTGFGEASQHATESHTAEGMIIGTAGYMAPEQVRGLPADSRSDIFAFGTILFEMLSGRRAFHADLPLETLTQILTKDPFAQESSDHFPPALHRIVSRCLEKNPAERFQSMRDLAFAIEALSDASGMSTVPREAVIPSLPTFKRLTFRKGYISSARFAPDGSTVIYSAAWDGEPLRVFMARQDAIDSLTLPIPDGDLLSVSPSGEMAILLNRETELGFAQWGILARAPILGGTPRQLMEGVATADWMPDGKSLAIVRLQESQNIMEFPAGNEVYKTGGWTSKIRVSRNGKMLAFADHPLFGDDTGTVAVIDASGNKKTLTKEFSSLEGVAWSVNDSEIWFCSSEVNSAERSLQAVSLDGQQRVVFRGPSSLSLLDISPSGKVLISRDSRRREARLLREDGTEQAISWLNWCFPVDLTADGTQLLFVEQGGGDLYEACVCDTKGSPPLKLGRYLACEFSPDETYVLAVQGFPVTTIHLLPVKLGTEQSIPLGDFQCSYVTYKDKNTVLALGSFNNESPSIHTVGVGRPIQPLNIKGPEIPTFWVRNPISPDGKWLAGWDAERKLRIYSLEENVSRAVPGAIKGEVSVLWSKDGSKIFTYSPGTLSIAVYCTDLNSGEKTLWKQIHPSDPSGVHGGLGPLLLSEDLNIYVYSFRRILAELYMADGLV